MALRIQLDNLPPHYTNLDVIHGRIILNLRSDTSIEDIVVKLEGESKTRLDNEKGAYDRPDAEKRPQKVELEVHKILYEVTSVLSSAIGQTSEKSSGFTLRSGQHEYPFSFKIPFLNSCFSVNSFKSNINMKGKKLELAKNTERHVQNQLPPTLAGLPHKAEIRYFVKATVKVAHFFKGNLRAEQPFNFLPIEPPRPPPSDRENFGRIKHILPVITQPLNKKKGFLGKFSKTPSSPTQAEEVQISIDARLPAPGILTCHEAVPLRVLVHKLSNHTQQLYVRNLAVRLVGTTLLRAHELQGAEKHVLNLVSHLELSLPVGSAQDPIDSLWELPKELWSRFTLPSSVTPSFETCNVARSYQLEVIVGLGMASNFNMTFSAQNIPVSIPVEVYSGIAPPPEHLARLQEGQQMDAFVSQQSSFSNAPGLPYGSSSQFSPLTPSSSNNAFDRKQLPYIPDSLPMHEDGAHAPPPSYEAATFDEPPPPLVEPNHRRPLPSSNNEKSGLFPR